MKLNDIKIKADNLGIVYDKKAKKADIIYQIQVKEGNNPCFGKSGGSCPYMDCCFRSDCLKIK